MGTFKEMWEQRQCHWRVGGWVRGGVEMHHPEAVLSLPKSALASRHSSKSDALFIHRSVHHNSNGSWTIGWVVNALLPWSLLLLEEGLYTYPADYSDLFTPRVINQSVEKEWWKRNILWSRNFVLINLAADTVTEFISKNSFCPFLFW